MKILFIFKCNTYMDFIVALVPDILTSTNAVKTIIFVAMCAFQIEFTTLKTCFEAFHKTKTIALNASKTSLRKSGLIITSQNAWKNVSVVITNWDAFYVVVLRQNFSRILFYSIDFSDDGCMDFHVGLVGSPN